MSTNETKKNMKSIDERTLKIVGRAQNHGLFVLLLTLFNIWVITTIGGVFLSASFTAICAFAGFFITSFTSTVIQEILY
ncbi:MAG: hypothetical protein ACFFC7_22630 [Candidatus Hermodarchaeota archaeon]